MKRIVVCCDGTWNSPDKDVNGVPVPTNVVKFATAVRSEDANGAAQMVYYDTGVGTSGSTLKQMFDGATGSGLSRNILEAYDFLARNYVLGDELFLLGFSRGAFTVRSLAGLIRNCGILRPNAINMVRQAYQLYRSSSKSSHPKGTESTLFRRSYSVADIVPIKFIGVWDTVGSLGNPLFLNGIISRRYRFHDTDLSSIVSFAYQALAIDEKRRHFEPALWRQQPHATNQVLEQVWFAGVHSNVGGGYPSTALSDIPLLWMCEKAKACGLALDQIPTRQDVSQRPDETWKGFYRLIPRLYRQIDALVENRGPSNEDVHPTVVAKYQQQTSYRPPNLDDYFSRFPDKVS